MSPHSTSVCAGVIAFFSVATSGAAPVYRWHHDGAPLADGPSGTGSVISGALTSTLTIGNAGAADAGQYACDVFNDCGSDSSSAATLTVTTCGSCPGDLDEDDSVSLTDLAILLSHFGDTGGASPDDGDIDLDGDIDISDLAQLLAHFGVTC